MSIEYPISDVANIDFYSLFQIQMGFEKIILYNIAPFLNKYAPTSKNSFHKCLEKKSEYLCHIE